VNGAQVSSVREGAVGLLFAGLVFVGAFGYAWLRGPAPAPDPVPAAPAAARPAPAPEPVRSTPVPTATPSSGSDGGRYSSAAEVLEALAATSARCDAVNLSSVPAADHPGVQEAWCLVTRGERADVLTADAYDSTATRDRELVTMVADAQKYASTSSPPGVLYGQNWSLRGPLTLLKTVQRALGGVLVPATP
jgi:hypothetical protein